MSMKRIVCLGEVLLRLGAPGHEPLLRSPRLETSIGGAEANVAIALANLGLDAALVSTLPANPLGDACLGELRRHGVDTSGIARSPGRLGLYFLTHGAMLRASTVVYDRADRHLRRRNRRATTGRACSRAQRGCTSPASRSRSAHVASKPLPPPCRPLSPTASRSRSTATSARRCGPDASRTPAGCWPPPHARPTWCSRTPRMANSCSVWTRKHSRAPNACARSRPDSQPSALACAGWPGPTASSTALGTTS